MSGTWRLRGYVVEHRLGDGASCDVWRARVASTGEPVALKRIPLVDADPHERAERRHRAQTEAALLTALDHAHLVRLHALVPTDDAVVLVLDLAAGGSLADLLRARGRLTPGEVITAVAPVGAALAYLHDEGVVHGDVSAANILFTAGGSPLLADVGVARLTGDERDAASTPAYIDPTVAAGGVPGPRSDVFMLAAVALHALTGEPAWTAPHADDALGQAARGELGDVEQRLAAAAVPPAMIRVLTKALTLDPQRRGTAADLALDLRHSGEPAAVELLAGRRAGAGAAASTRGVPAGPRHAAVLARPDARRRRWGAAQPPTEPDPGRPAFERPARLSGAAEAPAAPPTRMVQPRPRPVVPTRRRRRPSGRAALAALAVLVAVLAAAGTVWASTRADPGNAHGDGPRSTAARAVSGASAASRHPASSSRRTTAHTPHPTPATQSAARPPDAAQAAAALDALDRVRASAYATRDAALLRRVYASAALRTADTRQLQRTVPPGCVLAGVRTTYAGARLMTSSATHVVLTVRATLAASTLRCTGRASASAAGAGPTTLRVELTGTGSAMRISAQRTA